MNDKIGLLKPPKKSAPCNFTNVVSENINFTNERMQCDATNKNVLCDANKKVWNDLTEKEISDATNITNSNIFTSQGCDVTGRGQGKTQH